MNRILIALLIAAAPAALLAQDTPGRARFADLDRNGNGTLDATEIATWREARFLARDRNHDGVIDASEMESMSGDGARAFEPREASDFLFTYDANADLVVTLAEIRERLETGNFFEALDIDRSGSLSRAEMSEQLDITSAATAQPPGNALSTETETGAAMAMPGPRSSEAPEHDLARLQRSFPMGRAVREDRIALDASGLRHAVVRLPKNWTYRAADRTTPREWSLDVLGHAFPAERDSPERASAVFLSAPMSHEVHVADWLELWAISQDFASGPMDLRASPMGMEADLTASKNSTDYHLSARRSGTSVLLMVGRTASTGADTRFTDLDTLLMIGWETRIEGPNSEFVEDFPAVELQVPGGPVLFAGPQGLVDLQMQVKPSHPTILDTRQFAVPGRPGYLMAIIGRQGSDPEEFLDAFFETITLLGFTAPDPTPAPADFGEDFLQAKGWLGGARATLMFHLGQQERTPYLIAGISPAHEADVSSWAINRRAFGIAVDSLRKKYP